MKLLLDTHVLLWWQQDDARLRPAIRAIIADNQHTVFVSIASFWEIAVKVRLGKLVTSSPLVWQNAIDEGFEVLPILKQHLAAFQDVPKVLGHGDPFDILLVAQAITEGAALITADRAMPQYGVRCIGVR